MSTQNQEPKTTETDLIAKQANSLRALLDKAKDEIARALPRHLTPDRMMRIALTEARKNPQLLGCEKASFLGAVIQAAQIGLEPGGALGHCYLVPFKRKGQPTKEVQLIVGYKGMLSLIQKSGMCSHVMARAVYGGDRFEYEFGLNEKLIHVPSPDANGPLTHVYAVATLKDGSKSFDVMQRSEIDAVRARSQGGESGPWVTDFEAMAKKSVIRRFFKYLPSSIEMQQAITLDEMGETDRGQDNGSVISTIGRHVDNAKAEEINARLTGPAPTQQAEPKPEQAPQREPGSDDGDFNTFGNE